MDKQALDYMRGRTITRIEKLDPEDYIIYIGLVAILVTDEFFNKHIVIDLDGEIKLKY